jgi:DNA-binding LacI/PurR family transcriptional regulator
MEGVREVPGRKAATIYDVAALARVSHQSVSRLLKGERVSERTRLRVEAALEELNYRPNWAARSLATRRSNRIGALMYGMDQIGPVLLMTGAGSAARKAGYVLDIVSSDPADPASVDDAIKLLKQMDVAGILAFAPTDALQEKLSGITFQVPVYVSDIEHAGHERGLDIGGIAARLAAQHLLSLGHRRIANICGPIQWSSARSRTQAFHGVLADAGLESEGDFEGDWSAASGYELTRRILSVAPRATAIFAGNDQMALGALHALAERDISVPEAISVVGIDNTPESAFYNPSLSTVPMNFQSEGQFAFQGLLARIEHVDPSSRPDFIQTRVIARASTGPAPLYR